jgi:hypothetical protein
MLFRPLLLLATIWLGFSNSVSLATQPEAGRNAVEPPNIVFIMSDELAYFELSHIGNANI